MHLIRNSVVTGSWIVALLWGWRAAEAAFGLRKVDNLLDARWDALPEGKPKLVVIVPARNEEANIEACLDSLLGQDYPNLHILAVNDRSTDRTGELMERIAGQDPRRLSTLSIAELPPGWLGKIHAMAYAARHAEAVHRPEWMLFTDADILFAPDALRRSLVAAVRERADHFVTLPTPIIRRFDEAVFLGFFQVMGFWAVRLWRVSDPGSLRDSIGVGAFVLLRSSVYQQVGGFESLRMEVLEDVTLGRRIKFFGLRQRVAFGRDLVRVHWAAGALGIVEVLTKNLFSLFRFHLSLVLLAATGIAMFTIGPAAALTYAPTRIPAFLALGAVAFFYRLTARYSGISAWSALLFPFAAALFLYSLLRSTWITLRLGGVEWRGTFYSLEDLRRNAEPLIPGGRERARDAE